MESLTSWGYISPTTPDKLYKLKEYYENHVLTKKEHLTPKLAEKLLALLLSVSGEIDDEGKVSNQRLTENARAGLDVFYFFLLKDEQFQDAFERKETSVVSSRIQLKRHLFDRDAQHVQLTRTFMALVKRNFPKFVGWIEESEALERRENKEEIREETSVDLPRNSLDKSRLPPEGLYYDTDVKKVISLFQSHPENGLPTTEVSVRIEKYGLNKLPEPPAASPLKMFFHQLTDFMVLILLVVSIISFAFQHWIEASVLILVVFTNVMIGFVQELKAEKALQALKLFSVQTAKVIRNGAQETVESAQLVPGDIIILDEGDAIPADLRIFESIGLQIIESVLTGESLPITKTIEPIKKPGLTVGDRTNMAFMSTAVSKGRGKGVVVATGSNTEVGKISAALAKPKNRQTLLQKRLSKLGKILVVLAVILCAIVVGIGFARTYAKYKKITGDDAIAWVTVGISLAVSVIPEGLVAVTTITYALGIQRMMKRHAVVRKLPAVETIGSITTICSDKTGTLTEGKMTATQAWAAGTSYTVTGMTVQPTGTFVCEKVSDKKKEEGEPEEGKEVVDTFPHALEQNLMICAVCNNSSIFKSETDQEWTSLGDPTEVALTVAAEKAKLGKAFWMNERKLKFIGEAPFDSDRKRMSVVVALPDGTGMCLAKGAAESIVSISNKILWKNKEYRNIGDDSIKLIEEQNKKMGEQGMRVLGLGMKFLDESQMKSIALDKIEENEKDLMFVGLVGMIDPPRKEVRPTILGCKEAGIRVCMITGDHPRTAFAIGCMLGITEPGKESEVITGQQLDAMTKGDLGAMIPFPTVFARVSPANKLKIVNALQLKGEICAMTGDGTNDAPAIKNADVGIAMGKGATDMAKDSADVILADDNFTTIVEAIKEGRRTYDNIKKFVMYLLACNSAEIYTMLLSVIIGLPIPFTSIMILWANLIADIPPALALGVDPPVSDIMERKPRDPKKGIFTLKTAISLLFYGLSMSSITVSLYAIAIHVEHYPCLKDGIEYTYNSGDAYDICYDDNELRQHARDLAFVALTCMQLVHSFLVRSPRTVFSRDIISNRFLIGAYFLSLGLLVAGCYIPGVNKVLGQWPLDWKDWLKIILCVCIHVMFVEIYKAVLWRRYKKGKEKNSNYLFYNDA